MHRKVEKIAKDPEGNKRQLWDLNLDRLAPESILLTMTPSTSGSYMNWVFWSLRCGTSALSPLRFKLAAVPSLE